MPIQTSTDEWANAETYDRRQHSQILTFLRERPDRAFSPAEIAAEVYDTSALVGPEAVDDGHDPSETERTIVSAAEGAEENANRFAAILHVTVALEFLIDADLVTARYVPVSMVEGSEEGDERVALYCYDGE